MRSLLLFVVFAGFFSASIQEKIPAGAKILIQTYPDKIKAFKNDSLIWFDGTRMIWDDGIKNKTYDELLQNADVEDMFAIQYSTGEIKPPAVNQDPGRIRNEAFFKKMYGENQSNVKTNSGQVIWLKKTLKQKISFNKINGADKALQMVSDELDQLPDSLKKYLSPLAGTFNWRTIAGTSRLSAHSFNIAIDLNTKYSDYWLWQQGKTGAAKYRNRIPMAIVRIFEKHGFVWGGRWYHFDTMHFEYRPEIVFAK